MSIPTRDELSDDGREGGKQLRKEDDYLEIDVGVATLADEAWHYGPKNQPIAGTASDYAGLTSDIHRRRYEADPGANQTVPEQPPYPDKT